MEVLRAIYRSCGPQGSVEGEFQPYHREATNLQAEEATFFTYPAVEMLFSILPI